MSAIEAFGITFGIIGTAITIIAFLFSVWTWIRAKELVKILEAIDDLAGTVVWESHISVAEDSEAKVEQLARSLGLVEGIRKLTGRYVQRSRVIDGTEFGMLIERGIIWTPAMMWNVEASREVSEVWVVTPDLEPDASNKLTAKIVRSNIGKGKRYIYFYPNDLGDAEAVIAKLFHNLSFSGGLKQPVLLIPISREHYDSLAAPANLVLYFPGRDRSLPPRCFVEVLFTQVKKRGLFWQEVNEDKKEKVLGILESAHIKSFGRRNN